MYIIGSNRYLNKQTPFEEGTTRKQIGKRTQARAQLVDANRPRQLFCLFILIFSLFFVRLFASPFACVLFTRPQEVHHSFFELYSTSSTSFLRHCVPSCAFFSLRREFHIPRKGRGESCRWDLPLVVQLSRSFPLLISISFCCCPCPLLLVLAQFSTRSNTTFLVQ